MGRKKGGNGFGDVDGRRKVGEIKEVVEKSEEL
jgi:hypothetical protein